jgi:Ca-activated chloride channel family protein
MTLEVALLKDPIESTVDAGLGALGTERGNLPLHSIEASVAITGLVSRIELTQGFHNPHDVPLEATYIFPLPDRAAVTAMRMTADGRVVEAELKERGAAREEYDRAVAEGKRAAIAEEERPDVFTMRVGNILPGERVSVALTLVGPLSYEDGEATFRLPLVVAPRFIPGTPGGEDQVGDGYAADTDAVPDASRITPPVLLPGFPNPVRLAIEVDIDPAGLPLGLVRSSLHAVVGEGNHLSVSPGERANRDFILRLSYGEPDAATQALTLTPDPGPGDTGTFRLTVLPPTRAAPPRPRDVVLLLDRSGSMQGWKMVAARRAAARIVDTLTGTDRFAVLAFDNAVEFPPALGAGLHDATDRHRFRAVEHLSRMDARGGTVLLAPLSAGLDLLVDEGRDRVLVLVTDGQVGNEDQILTAIEPRIGGVRVHTVGIDQAVNAGFLGRLAAVGAGRCELVESEDRLDEAMDRIHRRIGAPVVAGLNLTEDSGTDDADKAGIVAGTTSPARLPDLFPGGPLVVTGRYRGALAAVTLTGRTRDGADFSARIAATTNPEPALTSVWARGHLRDLEDRYASGVGDTELEQRITATSLRFGVLCRFTAWLAVDSRIVADGQSTHRVIQPVETPAGWDMFGSTLTGVAAYAPMMAAPMDAARRTPGFAGPARMMAKSVAAPPPAPVAATPAAASGMAFPFPAEIAPVEQAGDTGRRQAGIEAARLRAAAGVPSYERRAVLADLGTRLPALLSALAALSDRDGAGLRRLIADCAGDRPLAITDDEFAELWERALSVLEDLAVGIDRAAKPKPFWKRR